MTDFLARYKKLIYGGIFLVILGVKSFFGIDVGTWFGITADINPETGEFVTTGLDKAVNLVLTVLGLLGIERPRNAPTPGQ